MQRPRVELEDALRRRRRFLVASATAFDGGDLDEAFRMAVDLRALLHYGQSPPLLHLLGLIKKMRFTDSGARPAPDSTFMVAGGLTVSSLTFGGLDKPAAAVAAPLGDLPPFMQWPPRNYTPWWKSDEVVGDLGGKRFTRRHLITEMANTDGAHVDAYLDGDYRALTLDTGRFQAQVGGIGIPVDGTVASASVRQIAWEVLDTLERECPDLL